ncbi:MAG: 3-deoxy-manno-octulosonate-8-phosphatase KdsC [Wenzhouxiangellaceae bacterium]
MNSELDRVDEALLARAARIRAVVFDVDGVLTDGRLYRSDDGAEIKAFHSRDGLGLKALMAHGIAVGVLTARRSRVVELRMQELGVQHLLQGREDKHRGFAELLGQFGVEASRSAYMGDDLVDWKAMRHAGLKLCPADADPWLRSRADHVTRRGGGLGAVREACELILAGHGVLEAWRERFACDDV